MIPDMLTHRGSDIGACRTAALDNALPPPLLKELPPAAAGVCGRRKMGERSSDHCQRRPAEQDFRGGIPVPDPARHIEQDDTFGCQFGESGIVRRRSGGRYQRRPGTAPATEPNPPRPAHTSSPPGLDTTPTPP